MLKRSEVIVILNSDLGKNNKLLNWLANLCDSLFVHLQICFISNLNLNLSMETIQTILELTLLGVADCICGSFALKRLLFKKNDANKEQSKSSRSRTSQSTRQSKPISQVFLQCVFFGFLMYLSIFIFNHVILKLYDHVLTSLLEPEEVTSMSWVSTSMNAMFTCFWKGPMFFASRVLTFVWYQDIADKTCEDVGIKKRVTQSKSEEACDQLLSAFVQTLFLIQSIVIGKMPMIAYAEPLVTTLHMAILYALYAFEYRWCQKGWTMSRRLNYIECKWPYFIGFGLPLALLTSCVESYIESICFFSVLFPITLIASTVTFNDRLKSFNKPVRFFGAATPTADIIVSLVTSVIKT